MTATSRVLDGDAAARIDDAILTDARQRPETPVAPRSSPAWAGLRELGTALWLDTGDLEVASRLWSREFSALTTNNTLLNAEIQKGVYDADIPRYAALVPGFDGDDLAVEIAYILNARHGLRLVQRFDALVSVELHTACAHDVARSLHYARRFARIAPQRFIVKLPLTPAGLLASRQLREEGIPVNLTLGFSARHNHLAAVVAKPSYVNVFLGRLGAYVADNGLGSGRMVGEKACLASQRAVAAVNATHACAEPVRQIAASMRDAGQVRDLAGVDVYTMPTKVAEAAERAPAVPWRLRRDDDPRPDVDGEAAILRVATLWEVDEPVLRLAESLDKVPARDPAEVVARAERHGLPDLFPALADEDHAQIAADGKIPRHQRWAERVTRGELAIDTLLNLAGLASFEADQAAMDGRIRQHLGR